MKQITITFIIFLNIVTNIQNLGFAITKPKTSFCNKTFCSIDTSDKENSNSQYYIGLKKCRINKIEKQKDVYIINATCDNKKMKIVSVKEKFGGGEKIKVNQEYSLEIFSYFEKSDIFHQFINFEITPGNQILADLNTRELYYTTSLRGLNYDPNNVICIYAEPIEIEINVTKIQDTPHFYYIYGKSKDHEFKILSLKDDKCKSDPIVIGNTYILTLNSYCKSIPTHFRYAFLELRISENIIVELDNHSRDLFYSNNLIGLCYSK